jgi:hypothetical protein
VSDVRGKREIMSLHDSAKPGGGPLPTDRSLSEALREVLELRSALAALLPLAEAYLRSAPTHPDNAKLEDARALLARENA